MQTLHCPHCGQDKSDDDFYKAPRNIGRRGRSSWCKLCTKAQTRDRKRANPEKYKNAQEVGRLHRDKWKALAIAALGGACVMCGEHDPLVLQFDHVNGEGYMRRHKYGSGGATATEMRAVALGTTNALQLLCPTCHVRKTHAAGEHLSVDRRSASC